MHRYEFSTHSNAKLLQFLNTAEYYHNKNPNRTINAEFENLLPKNEKLMERLNKFRLENEVNIDLTSENDDNIEVEIIKEIENYSSKFQENTKIEKLIDEEYFEIIISKIKSNNGLSDDLISTLKAECSPVQFGQLFLNLEKELDIDQVYHLGLSIIKNESLDINTIAALYCKYLLMPKVVECHSKKIFEMLKMFLNSYFQNTCLEMSKLLNGLKNDCPLSLHNALQSLEMENKQKILREFVLNCSKLNEVHFQIIESLITPQMDLAIFKKIIEMFSLSANEFSTNKAFGKILLNLVEKVERNINYCAENLRNIIAVHRTPYKMKLSKLLQTNLEQQSQLLTQTICY